MKTLRLVLKDRMSAGAIAALVGFLLLAQGLFGGHAQGTMASAAVDPFNILCIGHEADGLHKQQPGGGPLQASHDLCATLCQLAAGYAPALPSHATEIASPALREGIGAYFPLTILPGSVSRSLFAEARAPPFLSV